MLTLSSMPAGYSSKSTSNLWQYKVANRMLLLIATGNGQKSLASETSKVGLFTVLIGPKILTIKTKLLLLLEMDLLGYRSYLLSCLVSFEKRRLLFTLWLPWTD